LELDNAYSIYPAYLLENMSGEEKSNLEMAFTLSMFSDMIISVDEVFENVV